MSKEKLVITCILATLLFGIFAFVHIQQANCEDSVKSNRVLRDIDFLPDEINKSEDNPFKKILTDGDISKFDEEQRMKEQRINEAAISAILIFLVAIIFISRKKILLAAKKNLHSIYCFLKFITGVLSKNKTTIGKFIISLIAIFAFYRCVIKPPVYYKGFHNSKVYDRKNGIDEVPTIDIYKVTSELFGMAILSGLVYLLLIKKSGKNS